MMGSYAKRFLTILTTNIAIISLVYLTLIILNKTSLLHQFNGLYFDSYHYQSIAESGYNGFLVAFFPFFPIVWKVLSLTPLTACLFNLVTYSAGYALLGHHLQTTRKQQLLYQFLPSFAFFFLPYSESLFFLFSTIVIIGVIKNDNRYLLGGLLLCTLTRPIAFVFLPALILFYWFRRGSMKDRILNIIKAFCPILIGLFIVFLIQRIQTGEWFSFFKVQEEGWGNKLSIPNFPLMSWGGDFMSLYDGITLWTCMLFGCISLKNMLAREVPNSVNSTPIMDAAQLSMLILAGTGLMILVTRGGMLFSLNRFVVASPFFIIALHTYFNDSISRKQAMYISLSLLIFSLFLGSYNHIRHISLYIAIATLVFALLFTLKSKELVSKAIRILSVFLLIGIQVYFFYRILTEQWTG
jgi:hypothetical protein